MLYNLANCQLIIADYYSIITHADAGERSARYEKSHVCSGAPEQL